MTVHGECSLCGGAVVTPNEWDAPWSPIPTCMSCGATKRHHGTRVIAMEHTSERMTREQADKILRAAKQAIADAEEVLAEGDRRRCVM